MKLKKIVLITFIGIVVFWMGMIFSGYHFYSVDITVNIPWILILLLGIYAFLAIKQKVERVVVTVLISAVLAMYIGILLWGSRLITGIEGKLQIVECACCEKKVISYFHQGLWGGTPLETTGIGETYLGGWVYRTTTDTTYFAEYQYANEVDSNVVLPNYVNHKDLVFVWRGQKILLIFKNGGKAICLPLKYRSEAGNELK